jgi:FkbM family methyltransferase
MKPRTIFATAAALATLAAVALASAYFGLQLGSRYAENRMCCQTQNLRLALREVLGLTQFYSQIGQDRWVLETAFPGVTDGFFLDIGSGDGTSLSNSKALEQRGWRGICIDPFPTNMEGRTCQMLKEVVFSEAGKRIAFQAAGEVGGIRGSLGKWKDEALAAKTVELTTVTLRDILERTKAPQFIHFVSLDIEGAELDALKGFPFEKHTIGALAVEHNQEEPKRTEIEALMRSHGYRRVHSWYQDDFYVLERPR